MWRRTWLVFSQAVTVAVALLFVVLTLKPEWLQRDRLVTSPLPPATLVQAAPPTASVRAPTAAMPRPPAWPRRPS